MTATSTQATRSEQTDGAQPAILDRLEWRCIGPHRGGRVVAVAGHSTDPLTFYFGACAGGVWKSTCSQVCPPSLER